MDLSDEVAKYKADMSELYRKSERHKNQTKKSRIFDSIKKRSISEIKNTKNTGYRFLFWRLKGISKRPILLEMNFAKYLIDQKNVHVDVALCDGILSGCIDMTVFTDKNTVKSMRRWKSRCSKCLGVGRSLLKASNVLSHYTSKWITPEKIIELRHFADEIDIDQIEDYEVDGTPLGDISITGVLRYFRSLETGRNVTNDSNEYLKRIMREYFYSSLVSHHVSKQALLDLKPDYVFIFRGMYPLWAPMVYNAVHADIPITCWLNGYQRDSVFMKGYDQDEGFTQFQSPQRKHWEKVKKIPLNKKQKKTVNLYMTNRIEELRRQPQFWYGYQLYGKNFPSAEELRKKLNISPDKKIWMINSHCNWDWDIYIENKIFFRDPIEWFIKTFEIAMDNTNVEWIIRTHPAENDKNTKLLCKDIILQKFKIIPDHIRIITSDSNINSYSMFPLVDGCITMQSTVGFEMALFGKPVILGDYGFYGNKGFTYNPKTLQEYTDLLNNIESIGPLNQDEIDVAKRYVYDFLFYRQIPLRDHKYCNTVKGNLLYRMIYKRLVDLDQVGWEPPPLGKNENPEQYDWRKRLIEGWKNEQITNEVERE